MKRRFHIPIILLLLIGSVKAGDKIDSLRTLIASLPDDTNKVNALVELGMRSRQDRGTSNEAFEQALTISKELNWKRGEARSYYKWGYALYLSEADHDTMRQIIRKAQSVFRQLPDTQMLIEALNVEAKHWLVYVGDYPKALELFQECLDLAINSGNQEAQARALNGIGVVYESMEDYEKTVDYYLRSLAIKEKLNDELALALGYYNLGLVYMELGKLEMAEEYLNRSLPIYQETLLSAVPMVLNGLAEVHLKAGRYNEALSVAQHADTLWVDPWTNTTTKLILGKSLIVLARMEEANVQLQEGIRMARESRLPLQLRNLYETIARCQKGMGDYQSALRYQELFLALKDSLQNEKTNELVARLELSYETEKKDKELAQLGLEKEKEESRTRALTWGIALAGVIVFLLILFYRTKSRSNRELVKKNELIEQSLKEREMLMYEIHHRVKNNLQLISSMLELQSFEIDDPKALESMAEGRDRIQSMAVLHEMLYQQEELSGIDAQDYVKRIADHLLGNTSVTPRLAVDNMRLDIDTAIPIGLIINEAITNSLKYAGSEGILSVSLKHQDAQLVLEIRDDGPGFPKSIQENFGMRMMRSLCRLLKAEMETLNDKGAVLRLTISRFKLVEQ